MLLMGRDKKVLDAGYTFALLGSTGVEVVHEVDPILMRQALEVLRPSA
jgi:hypothetical protein